MDVDDTKNLYKVRDPPDEYDGSRDDFPHRPIANIKINDQIYGGSKLPLIIVIGFLIVLVFINIILLGMNGATLAHLNTLPVCDNSNTANTGGLTSGGGGSISCDTLTANISQIANMSKTVLANQNDDNAQGVAQASLLTQMNQRLVSNLTQLVNTAQRTESKVDDVQSSVDYQMTVIANVTDVQSQIWQSVDDTAQRLTNIVSTLSDIKDTGTSTAGVIDDVLLAVNELLALQNASSLFNSITPVSCADIKRVLPNSPSGYYHVNSRNIYCNMGELCGSGGGWTRLAYLNMNDATQNCPSGFRYYSQSGVRACGRLGTSGNCASITYPSNGINYTQICGRVTGYQKGHTDAFQGNNINSYYVDGVSITRGSPRQHVWTLMSGVWENRVHSTNCPCNTGTNRNIPSFIGNNYYCESGNPTQGYVQSMYTGDPLWDGQLCRNLETGCCTNPNLPWFYRNYGNVSSNAYLELRICGNEGYQGEDTPVSFYEVYVK